MRPYLKEETMDSGKRSRRISPLSKSRTDDQPWYLAYNKEVYSWHNNTTRCSDSDMIFLGQRVKFSSLAGLEAGEEKLSLFRFHIHWQTGNLSGPVICCSWMSLIFLLLLKTFAVFRFCFDTPKVSPGIDPPCLEDIFGVSTTAWFAILRHFGSALTKETGFCLYFWCVKSTNHTAAIQIGGVHSQL